MKHSLRRLLKSPAFALTAIITVGAAIGANALIFSVVNGVILKPLPYANPSSLVGAWLVAPGVMPGPLQQSAGTYFMIRDSGQVFTDIGLWQNGSVTVTGRGEPEQVQSLNVTDGTLPVLGVDPIIGRGFSKEEDLPNGPKVVLISHRYWQRVFSSSPNAVGQSITINGAPFTVIGVLPEGFRFPALTRRSSFPSNSIARKFTRPVSATRGWRGSSLASALRRPTPTSPACSRH